MRSEVVYSALVDVGLGEYEARAYCALLAESPANGYDVAKRSGVPRAKVYECLDRLVARGAIVPVDAGESGSRIYAPVDPETLLSGIEQRLRNACEHASTVVAEWRRSPQATEVLWRIASVGDLINRARSLASEAEQTLHVALWPDEFSEVLPALLESADRGVRMALVLYGTHPGVARLRESGAGALEHGASKAEGVPTLGRQFVLVADRARCISGSVFPDGDVDGAYTLNRGLTTNAVDLVNHEIYLERILLEVGEPVTERYGSALERLDAFDVPDQ